MYRRHTLNKQRVLIAGSTKALLASFSPGQAANLPVYDVSEAAKTHMGAAHYRVWGPTGSTKALLASFSPGLSAHLPVYEVSEGAKTHIWVLPIIEFGVLLCTIWACNRHCYRPQDVHNRTKVYYWVASICVSRHCTSLFTMILAKCSKP